jgi:DNA-binding IclR family transcriptional regulator
MNERKGPKRIKTTETVFKILRCIQQTEPSTVTDLTSQLNISKSTIHTHLYTLQELGYLVQEDEGYRLGLPFLTLGGHVQQSGPYGKLYQISKPEIDELADMTGERTQIVVEENGWGYYLYQATGERAVQADTVIGSQTPLHSTAVGKALLAHMSTERVDEIIDRHGLPPDMKNTLTDREHLFNRLDRIEERGYSFDRGERVEGIYCVGAPVMAEGTVYGAVSVSIPNKRAEEEFFEERLPDLVTSVAQVISLNTKYS